MGSRSELDALLREVKRLSDAETRQREIVTELGRYLKEVEHENRLLENRIDALEQAIHELKRVNLIDHCEDR